MIDYVTAPEERLLSSLRVGVENALRVREIGFNSRDIRLMVASLREKGFPICSGIEGYWIAKNQHELDRTIIQLKSRMHGINKAIDGLKRAEVTP